ncbi:MAG: orotidine-5'-phosphate decarboxylase [Thermoplasmatota archaeon]
MDFRARLVAAARERHSWICLGLDPDPRRLPPSDRSAAGAVRFCNEMLDKVGDRVCAVKPQSAYFEAMGPGGMEALAAVIDRARGLGHVVILDAKRGDIGETSAAYASAAFDFLKADAVTVNPYMGYDAVEPFLRFEGKGVFLLCRTSNPSSKDFQELTVGTERLYERVARTVAGWDHGALGLVCGATYPDDLARVRSLVGPAMPILVPGVGAQGGEPADAARGANPAGEMVLVNASRSILFAKDPGLAAEQLRQAVATALAQPARMRGA